MARALFVCRRNAGRSQMAEALFERAVGGRHSAQSAGTQPEQRVHPEVIEVMHELGIDLQGVAPRRLSDPMVDWADVVVTMGCGDACPVAPGTRRLDWQLDDPQGRPVEELRATREEIGRRIDELVAELDSADDWTR